MSATNALADAVVVGDGVALRAVGSPDPWRHPGVGVTEGGAHQLRVRCGGRGWVDEWVGLRRGALTSHANPVNVSVQATGIQAKYTILLSLIINSLLKKTRKITK